MTVPANLGPNVPTISLGGFDWPIPDMSLAQNRVLQPLFGKVSSTVLENSTKIVDLSEDDFDALTEIAYIALTRAHPKLTREEMGELPIGLSELIGCLLPIMSASKLFPKKVGDAVGEAVEGASLQTGTA